MAERPFGHTVAADMPSPACRMKKLGVGIVGANWAARGHLPGWRMLPDHCEPIAICTTRLETAENAAAMLDLPRAYVGLDAMLHDPDIAIISLGGPPPVRETMTLAALAAGKHVFSCIPFATSASRAKEMAAAQRNAGLVGALDAYFLWTPAYSFLKDLIDEGFLGELYAVNIDFSMSQAVLPPADYAYRWTGLAKNGTGVLPNSCSHVFHTLIHLFGPVTEVIGETRLSNKIWMFEDGTTQIPEVPDTAVILARLTTGALVNIHAGRAVPSGTGFSLTAYGSKGQLSARSPAYPYDRNVTLTSARPARLFAGQDEPLEIPSRYFEVPGGRRAHDGDAHVAISLGRLYGGMIEAIRNGEEAPPSFTRGALVQTIVETIQRSQTERRWQPILSEELLLEPAFGGDDCVRPDD